MTNFKLHTKTKENMNIVPAENPLHLCCCTFSKTNSCHVFEYTTVLTYVNQTIVKGKEISIDRYQKRHFLLEMALELRMSQKLA